MLYELELCINQLIGVAMNLNENHPVKKDAEYRKSVVAESIHTTCRQLQSSADSFLFSFDNIKVFDDLDDINEKEGMNIPSKYCGKMSRSCKFKVDFEDEVSSNYACFVPLKLLVSLEEIVCEKEDVDLLIIQDNSFDYIKYPDTNCMHYRDGFDFAEMLDIYQPAKVIYYLPPSIITGGSRSVIAIYLLDRDDNFLTKLFIEIIDELVAPKDSKKLKVPKTIREFNNLL